jgi:hypothetical protein
MSVPIRQVKEMVRSGAKLMERRDPHLDSPSAHPAAALVACAQDTITVGPDADELAADY